MLVQVCEVLWPSPYPPAGAQRGWVNWCTSTLGAFIFHLWSLTVKKQICTSLDCEGSEMEGRAPHCGCSFARCCVIVGLQGKNRSERYMLWYSSRRTQRKTKMILNPFQIIVHLTFMTPSLTTHLIQKYVRNITYFVVACFINKSSSRIT
jgi:hypothetical protein